MYIWYDSPSYMQKIQSLHIALPFTEHGLVYIYRTDQLNMPNRVHIVIKFAIFVLL